MQLKIKRSQRDAGLISTSMRFSVYARAEFTDEERRNLIKYKLGSLLVYQSPKARSAATGIALSQDGSVMGDMRSMKFIALAAMNLNIRVRDLEDGRDIECKSLDEVLGAEEAIITACQNLDMYLSTAATFDGREVTVDIVNGEAVAANAGRLRHVSPEPAQIEHFVG